MAGAAKWLISPLGAAVGLFDKPKAADPRAIMPVVPTRSAAAGAAARDDVLRRRRGAGANELTGGGAEAATAGGKTLLGQ